MKFVLILVALISTGYTIPLGPIPSSGSGASLGTAILTPLNNLPDTLENAVAAVAKSKTLTPGFPDSGRQQAVLEDKIRESLPIQIDDKYGNAQNFIASFFNPKPIVDTIQEHEKYGNDGDHFRKAANVLIGGLEGVSNGLNAIVEIPLPSSGK
ncbi:hypothetical protein NQ317_014452 [Molorchus minor]|uniref:Uncharacterized protein n=1 Tax=Molorchus minor TaxID=1323400 RepID=A0ABQ9J4Z4_9CUCU|nr:hypothetical protein NQ317_014452 [Molorchus minor]